MASQERPVVTYHTPGNDDISTRFHSCGLHDSVYGNRTAGTHCKILSDIAANMDITRKIDVSCGIIHISLDLQHSVDLEGSVYKFQVSLTGSNQLFSILREYGIRAGWNMCRLYRFGFNDFPIYPHSGHAGLRQRMSQMTASFSMSCT